MCAVHFTRHITYAVYGKLTLFPYGHLRTQQSSKRWLKWLKCNRLGSFYRLAGSIRNWSRHKWTGLKMAEITAAITYNGTPGISVNHSSHEGQTLQVILYQVSLDKHQEKWDKHYCAMEAQCSVHFRVPPLKNKDISKDRKLKYFNFCARGEPCTPMRTKV